MLQDNTADFYGKGIYDNIESILSAGREGYSREEFARVSGAWAVHDYFHKAFSWEELSDANSIMEKPVLGRCPVADPGAMSEKIREAARMFGAAGVGIARIDRRWIYACDRNGSAVEIPDEYEFAIVMIIRMDPKAIGKSPAFAACAETGLAYSRMTSCIGSLAEYIRSLGYCAIPMCNDTALSIPLAIDAGLGEMGRNGLLITPGHGPCVRICKVFTDIPLKADKPIEFGVADFCRKCKKCAHACQADAIGAEEEPSFDTACPSNNPGILRWTVDHDRCYGFWLENGGDCSSCIAACPFFPRE